MLPVKRTSGSPEGHNGRHHIDHVHDPNWNESCNDDHRPYDHQYGHDHGRLVHGELVHECVRPPKPREKGAEKAAKNGSEA